MQNGIFLSLCFFSITHGMEHFEDKVLSLLEDNSFSNVENELDNVESDQVTLPSINTTTKPLTLTNHSRVTTSYKHTKIKKTKLNHCPDRSCRQTFITKKEKENHVARKHGGKKNWGCDFCDKAYSTQSSLSLHITRNHTEKSKICPIESCLETYALLGDLNQHLKRKHPDTQKAKDEIR